MKTKSVYVSFNIAATFFPNERNFSLIRREPEFSLRCFEVEHRVSDDWIDINKDPKHVARERAKAKELRKSEWWKQHLAKGVCHYCEGRFPASELTMDHVLAVVRGGKSVKSNCVPCCKQCNSQKTYLTPAEQIMRELENEKKDES